MSVEFLTERVAFSGGRVDTANHIIRNVKILGTESKNGRTYPLATIRAAADKYENAKVNLNHPKGRPDQPRDYQDRLGHLENVRVEGSGLYGDLRYNPRHAVAPMLEYDAEHAPQNLGFSHNVQASTSRQNGKIVVESITRVVSVDLVADPATTGGIFESTGDDEQFGDASARRDGMSTREFVSLVTGQPEHVTEWLAGDGAKLTKGEPQTESFEGPTIESTAEFLSILKYGVDSQDGFQPLGDGRRRRWN